MMKKRYFKILVLCGLFFIFFLNSFTVNGQYFEDGYNRFLNNFSINVSGGPTLFFGDIHSKTPFQEDWKPAFGIALQKQFSPVFGASLQFIDGKIHGTILNWNNGDTANLVFNTDIIEFNLNATVNFSNLFFGFKADRTFNVYGLAGFGIANWMSTLNSTTDGSIVAQYGVSPQGTKAWTPAIAFPLGLGINLSLSPTIGLNIQSVYHIINSDNLDAYNSGKGANDPYLFTSLGISYKIFGSAKNYATTNSSASNYEKMLEKQTKYQQRMADKEKKQQLRDEEKQAREKAIDEKRNNTWGVRNNNADLPKVAEYDPQYSFREKKSTTGNIKPQSYDTIENPPPTEIVTIDEGKHFITGVKSPPLSSNPATSGIITGTKPQNIDSNTLSVDILQIPKTGTFYTVQILASQTPVANINDIRLKYYIGKQIFVSQQDGIYRYSAGYFDNYDDAVSYSKQLKTNGLSDAFVSIYQNGSRIFYRPK